MAMASGFFGLTLRDAMDTSDQFIDFLAHTFNMQLVADAYTPDFNAHDLENDITNEVTGTGISAGGQAIGTTTWAASSGFLTFDISTDEQWTTATGSNIRGRVIYDNTPAGGPLVCATTFGADYSVTAGTFTVTEHANGIFRIDYVP